MAITNRTMVARFSVANPDGADSDSNFENVYLGGVTVQFIPWPTRGKSAGTTMFLRTYEGVSDNTGNLKSPDGSTGVGVPVLDPSEGVTQYTVRVTPPDGVDLRPYTFTLNLTPGSTPVDITDIGTLVPENPGVTALWVGPTAPAEAAAGVWWLDTSDPYRHQYRKWVA